MGAYWDVIAAVYDRVSAIDAFVSASPPVPVVRHKKPQWNSKIHRSITVIVAGKDDYAEEIDPEAEATEKVVGLKFPVWVGLIHDERFDDATLKWFLDGRQAVREAAWDLTLPEGLGGGYQIEYDPSGSGAMRGGEGGGKAPNLDESWQRFDVYLSLARCGAAGR